jgi:hypothetical protein
MTDTPPIVAQLQERARVRAEKATLASIALVRPEEISPEWPAAAHIMALLEALEGVSTAYDAGTAHDVWRALKHARTAIAKVRGQS